MPTPQMVVETVSLGGFLLGMVFAIIVGLNFGAKLATLIIKLLEAPMHEGEKPKNEGKSNSLEKIKNEWVYLAEDEKPKRFYVITDDGELEERES